MLTVPALTLRFRSRYPAVARSVRIIRSEVGEIARDCGAGDAALEALRMAVSEAARDAAGSGPPGTYVYVSVELGDGELVVSLCDDGAGDTDVRLSFACALAVDQEHNSAEARLKGAVAEQDRLIARMDAAAGTSREGAAHASLRAANDQVAARQAWLHWVDDEAYRGLNAGPFELRADPT